MKENFNDIFESINLLHKKYKSKNYIDTIENFNKDSRDLEEILEKYKIDVNNISIKKNKKKNPLTKKNKKEYNKKAEAL